MMVPGLARGLQRLIGERVVTGTARNVISLRLGADRPTPFEFGENVYKILIDQKRKLKD